MDFFKAVFGGGGEEAVGAGDEGKMSISTPREGAVAFGDLPTPMAEARTANPAPVAPKVPVDKKLSSWKIGPRYVPTSILGRGSYGEVAAGIDTVT